MPECVYCQKEVPGNVVFVCELPYSKVYLFKEQTHTGRCVVVEKVHHRELFELKEETLQGLITDVAAVVKAIDSLYHPDKINYGSFSDTMGHIHFHVVPKWKEKEEWGGTFVINLNKTFPSEEILAKLAEEICHKLSVYMRTKHYDDIH